MKLFIADNLSAPVDLVFAAPAAHPAFDQFFATVAYAFFLYADFAGYSLIAIGSARLLGLDVVPNFAQPFLSPTIPEYWRRWHMSLSFWVRDYVFSPIRTNWRRRPQLSLAAALILSFIIIGVWHGPKWGYLFFGILHGTYCVISSLTLKMRNQFWGRAGVPSGVLNVVRIPATFFLALLAFVVYRANNLSDALTIYRSIFSIGLLKGTASVFHGLVSHSGSAPTDIALVDIKICLALLAVLIAGDIVARRKISFASLPRPLQISIANAGIAIVLSRWILGHGNETFAYYKF
jgi:D-alanyl-lipoteichoic acid acyltransferase DltB (MBOAT superfamily)